MKVQPHQPQKRGLFEYGEGESWIAVQNEKQRGRNGRGPRSYFKNVRKGAQGQNRNSYGYARESVPKGKGSCPRRASGDYNSKKKEGEGQGEESSSPAYQPEKIRPSTCQKVLSGGFQMEVKELLLVHCKNSEKRNKQIWGERWNPPPKKWEAQLVEVPVATPGGRKGGSPAQVLSRRVDSREKKKKKE